MKMLRRQAYGLGRQCGNVFFEAYFPVLGE